MEGAAQVWFTRMPLDPPTGLVTEEYVLRPIVAADTALDYDAVMKSKEFLRPWEQTGWPTDDFSVEDDLADVTDLEQRHRSRQAFTFSLLDPEETRCLGCVYLMPPNAKSFAVAEITPAGADRWEDVGATVYFWVRTSRLGDGLDRRLLTALPDWLERDWDLGQHVFVTNEQVGQQVDLFTGAGLQLRFRIKDPAQDGAYLAFG